MGLAYILAPLSGKAKSAGRMRAAIKKGQGGDGASFIPLIPSITTRLAVEQRCDATARNSLEMKCRSAGEVRC